jgi:S-adenosyl-L-methionine hydrolase (adenosine-forming)
VGGEVPSLRGGADGRRKRPVVTLTTDFGLRDPFAGVMKGVIVGICPEATVVDLSHAVRRHDVLEAQLVLEAAHRFFPSATVHLAVVDPGVGSRRRALAVESGGQYYVGPDNGIFTFALEGDWRAVSIESADHRLAEVSSTFHGRDVFAPVAAHLASGLALEALGPAVADPIRMEIPRATREGGQVCGVVIGTDHFGNATTSVSTADLAWLGPGPVGVLVGEVLLSLVPAYSEVGEGAPGAILGSQGRLEIFVREGSAQAVLGLARGTPVRAARLPPATGKRTPSPP